MYLKYRVNRLLIIYRKYKEQAFTGDIQLSLQWKRWVKKSSF